MMKDQRPKMKVYRWNMRDLIPEIKDKGSKSRDQKQKMMSKIKDQRWESNDNRSEQRDQSW